MSLLATLDVALRGDTSSLDKALQKGEGSVQKFTISIKQAGDKSQQSLSNMGGGGAAAAGLVAGAVVMIGTALVSAGKQVANFVLDSIQGIDNLARTAATLGVTTTALAGLQHGAAVAGVSTEDLNHGLEKFQKHIAEAGQGSPEVLASFAKLGLSFESLKDKQPEEQLAMFGDALAKTGSEADKLQITLAVMGKGAGGLKEFLKGGTEGMAAMEAEAQKLGLAVSGEQAAQVQEATKGWREFMEAITGIGRSLAVIFAPVLAKITDLFKQFSGEGASALSSNIKFFQQLASAAWSIGKAAFEIFLQFGTVYPLLQMVGRWIMDNVGSWDDFKDKALTAVWTLQFYMENWRDKLGLIFDKVKRLLVGLGNDFTNIFTKVIPDALAGKGINFDRPATDLERKLDEGIREREEEMEENLAEFLKEKMDEFKKPPVPDKPPGKGNDLSANFTKPAAMEAGSAAAFSVLFNQQSAQDKAFKVANENLQENKKVVKLLEKIAEKRFGIKKGKV